ncbi:hypothetical protein GCM10020000_43270 [Streptomyces olivoverticillatus]
MTTAGGRFDCDVLVVGGGIVGLSTAYAITRAAPGTRVVVLEKESGPARHQTGRNSGVIHSGVYYRPGSLKARYAVQGAAEMVTFCAEHGLPYEVTGKLIVATERAELPRLHALAQRGRENGIPVRELGRAQIAEYEPRVRGIAALHVGTTGVCDFGAVAGRLARLAQEAGAEVRYGAEVRVIRRRADAVAVRTAGGRGAAGPGAGQLRGAAQRPGGAAGGRCPPACGSFLSAGSTSSWPRRVRTWCALWCIRCRIRRSPSWASI